MYACNEGSKVLKYPELFLPLQCKKIRTDAIKICVLEGFFSVIFDKLYGSLGWLQFAKFRKKVQISNFGGQTSSNFFSDSKIVNKQYLTFPKIFPSSIKMLKLFEFEKIISRFTFLDNSFSRNKSGLHWTLTNLDPRKVS